ncbi:MAG TPA: VTT domain-containing protein [Usitatibacter sp.]|jgi:membrane protein DedA with SNARE-associated domain/rhodanese-related sulfurtransferase|nr:VTT domain-containing protein [Usitatibacter sp.]
MDLIRHLFDAYGTGLVFVNALLHEAGVPVPLTPTVIIAAGWYGSAESIVSIVAAVTLGTVAGNAIWFYAGRRYGTRVLLTLCRVSLSPDTCVAKTSGAFDKWGGMLLVVGRFIPGVSLVAPPMAGMTGMSWPRFLGLTLLGGAVWALVMALAGMALQAVLQSAIAWMYTVPASVWATPLAVLAGYIAWRLFRKRRARDLRNVPRIEPSELQAQMRSGPPPAILDVRGPVMRAADEAIVLGATNISLDALRAMDVTPLAQRRVVVFCGCPNEASAASAALMLHARGVPMVYVLRGGIDALKAAGLAEIPGPPQAVPDPECAESECPMSSGPEAGTSLSSQASSRPR